MSPSLTAAMKIPLYFSDPNCLKQFTRSPVMMDSNLQYGPFLNKPFTAFWLSHTTENCGNLQVQMF